MFSILWQINMKNLQIVEIYFQNPRSVRQSYGATWRAQTSDGSLYYLNVASTTMSQAVPVGRFNKP